MTVASAPASGSQGSPAFMRNPPASPGATAELRHAGGVRSLDTLRAIVQAIRRICLNPTSRPRVKDLALIDIDPADLSELGRERRQRALEELHEAQRRLSKRGPPLRYSNSISR